MGTNGMPSGKTYQSWEHVFKDARQMPFRPLRTGSINSTLEPYTQEGSLPSGADRSRRADYAVMVFCIRHPEKGDLLIDSGFDQSFHTNPPFGNLAAPVREYLESNRVRYSQQKNEDLGFQLKRHNMNPSCLFLTHMHPDHTAGIPALSSDCKIHYGQLEHSAPYLDMSGNHLEGKKEIRLLDASAGRAMAPFDRVLDLFGDGAIWALSTPGHTKDHFAYLVNAAPRPMLIVGDAELTKWGMEHGVYMNTDYGEQGKRDVQNSATAIRQFHALYPEVQIWFSHDEQPIML